MEVRLSHARAIYGTIERIYWVSTLNIPFLIKPSSRDYLKTRSSLIKLFTTQHTVRRKICYVRKAPRAYTTLSKSLRY